MKKIKRIGWSICDRSPSRTRTRRTVIADDYLDHVVLVVEELVVRPGNIIHSQVVGYDEGRIESARLNVAQKSLPIPTHIV